MEGKNKLECFYLASFIMIVKKLLIRGCISKTFFLHNLYAGLSVPCRPSSVFAGKARTSKGWLALSSNILPSGKKFGMGKLSSLFCSTISDEEEKLSKIDTWEKFYKTFYGCNL
jgi:hypothetical protein